LKIRIAELRRHLPGRQERCQVNPEQPAVEPGQLPQSGAGYLQRLLQERGLISESAHDVSAVPAGSEVLRQRLAAVGNEDGPHTVAPQFFDKVGGAWAGGVLAVE